MEELKYNLYFKRGFALCHVNGILVFDDGKIYTVYVKFINGRVHLCKNDDILSSLNFCSVEYFKKYYNNSIEEVIEKVFDNRAVVLNN